MGTGMGDGNEERQWAGQPERRRTKRVDVRSRMPAQLLALNVPVTVIQIGLGGFRVRTSFVFLVGSIHEFRFPLGDGSTVDVSARVIHCLPRVTKDGTPVYVTGLEYVDSDDRKAETAATALLKENDSPTSSTAG